MKIQYNDPLDKKYFVIKKDELCEFVLMNKHTHWWQSYPVTRGKIPFVITTPRGVTVVKENAFFGLRAGYDDKIRVVIDEGVREIEKNAFANAEIAELVISNTVSKIHPEAFRGARIASIEVDKGNFVFKSEDGCLFDKNMYTLIRYGQAGKREYTIPKTVCTIEKRAFENTKILESVTFPEGLVNINDGAFYASNIREINLPNSVKTIGQKAFAMCQNLTTVKLPDDLIAINHKMFYGCERLAKINIPKAAYSLGIQAFHSCRSLTSLELPETISSIGKGAFEGCTLLKAFNIPYSVRRIEERTFAKCDCFTDIIIPDSVEEIECEAFAGCKRLFEIKIPSTVGNISDYAFLGCNEAISVALVGRDNMDKLPFSKKWNYLSKNGIFKKKIKNITYC